MHAVVMESLEEYLAGSLRPGALGAVEAHLITCPECREDVRAMQECSLLLGTLRTGEAVVPSAGFTARVMQEAGARQMPSFASLFSLDFAFGRRVIFASLLTLGVLGSYLVTRETSIISGPTPDAIIAAGDRETAAEASPDARDSMLATLVSYEQ